MSSITMIFIATILVAWISNAGGDIIELDNNDVAIEVSSEDIFFEIVLPRELAYTYRLRPARDFGTQFNTTFLGDVALVPVEPETGCTKPSNTDELSGNAVLVLRGDCTFLQKAAVAEDAGAKAVIISDYYAKTIDDERDSPMWMDYYYIDMTSEQDSENERDINIPVGFLLGKNGKMIKNTLKRLNLSYAWINIPINLTFTPLADFHQPPWVAL